MKACVVRIENKDLPTRIFRPEQYLSLDAIIVFEIVEPDTHAILLAQFIANQLVRRVAFKRAVRKAIENVS